MKTLASLALAIILTAVSNGMDQMTIMTSKVFTEPNGDKTVIDGEKRFLQLFHTEGGIELSYGVIRENPPTVSLASNSDKNKSNEHEIKEDNRNADIVKAFNARLKDGYKSNTFKNIFISSTRKLIIETVDNDEWNKGHGDRRYFSTENIIEVRSDQKLATILPRKLGDYPQLIVQFPALYSAIGLKPDAVHLLAGKNECTFGVVKNDLPTLFVYKINPQGLLLGASQTTYTGQKLRVSTFEYGPQPSSWPSEIFTEVFNSKGNILFKETWKLISIKSLEKEFNFNPVIDKDYRVDDCSGSRISTLP